MGRFLDPGLTEDDLSLDAMNRQQPVSGGSQGIYAGYGGQGFGNNLMAAKRNEMAMQAQERQRLMGGRQPGDSLISAGTRRLMGGGY